MLIIPSVKYAPEPLQNKWTHSQRKYVSIAILLIRNAPHSFDMLYNFTPIPNDFDEQKHSNENKNNNITNVEISELYKSY